MTSFNRLFLAIVAPWTDLWLTGFMVAFWIASVMNGANPLFLALCLFNIPYILFLYRLLGVDDVHS